MHNREKRRGHLRKLLTFRKLAPHIFKPCFRARETGGLMKRDLYAEVSARIVAELEARAAPWIGWRKRPAI
jgi:hypothetical protein